MGLKTRINGPSTQLDGEDSSAFGESGKVSFKISLKTALTVNRLSIGVAKTAHQCVRLCKSVQSVFNIV